MIATTRPELLPACVGVTAHPDDARYQRFFGKRAVTPLFRVPVPIFPSELADPEKGTGILMVCTFGDATDVHLVARAAARAAPDRRARRPARAGRVRQPRLREPRRRRPPTAPTPSSRARRSTQARKRDRRAAARPGGQRHRQRRAARRASREPIEHAVKFYEKGDRPLEFVLDAPVVRAPARQEGRSCSRRATQIAWHPEYMGMRFRDWTENLSIDWCVSRGSATSACRSRSGTRSTPTAAPTTSARSCAERDAAAGRSDDATCRPATREAQRDQPGGFAGEPDVFDTWFTSSLTPQIGSHWRLDPERHAQLFPADLRPQSHEIIRTWAFYTIAKALLHEGTVPWHHVAISGWILDPDRKKMSKSKGNVVTPMHLLEQYGADAVRYWAAQRAARHRHRVRREGASRSASASSPSSSTPASSCSRRRPSVRPDHARARPRVRRASCARWSSARPRASTSSTTRTRSQETESFFWARFTDTYLELAKARARGDDGDAAGRGSAVAALRLGLDVLLRLFAPFLPYITEEVWSLGVRRGDRAARASTARPGRGARDFAGVAGAGRRRGASSSRSTRSPRSTRRRPTARCRPAARSRGSRSPPSPRRSRALAPVLGDVLAAARCGAHRLGRAADLEAGKFAVDEIEFAERPTA